MGERNGIPRCCRFCRYFESGECCNRDLLAGVWGYTRDEDGDICDADNVGFQPSDPSAFCCSFYL